MRRWGLGLLLAAGIAQPAQAAELILRGGANLSSPRTALNRTLNSYIAPCGGVAIDSKLYEYAHAEIGLLYMQRRFAGHYGIPTVAIPAMMKFETRYLMLGVGVYAAAILAASNDEDESVTPTKLQLSRIDAGVLGYGGLKLPLGENVAFFIDGMFIQAATSSDQGQPFYWTQIAGFAGIRFALGKSWVRAKKSVAQ